jgi:phage major head subunit gpT-like protein
MIINKANLGSLFTGFKAAFNKGFGVTAVLFERVAMTVPSSTSQEQYAWLGKFSGFREWLGDRVIQNLSVHGFVIKNKTFENTVSVKRDDIEDDTFGLYSPLFEQLGQDAREHPDELVFGLFKQGFSTPCYDGQNFFDADHPVLDASGNVQSVSNYFAGTDPAWFLLCTKRVVKPFIYQKRRDYKFVRRDAETDEPVFNRNELEYGVDCRCNAGFGLWQLAVGSKEPLNAANYNKAFAAMSSFTKDGGNALNIVPDLLVVPPALREAALEVVKAERLANGATNINRDTADVLVTARVM